MPGLNGAPATMELYVDVVKSQTASYAGVAGRAIPILEQRSRAFPGLALLSRGIDIEQRINSGTRIESQFVANADGDFAYHQYGVDWSFNASSGHEYLVSHWRASRATESIDDIELNRAMGGGFFDSKAVVLKILNIDKLKKAKMWTRIAEVSERRLWVDPVLGAEGMAGNTMELPAGLQRSLLSIVNEYQPAHHAGGSNNGLKGLPPTWTTQHGQNPLAFMSTDGSRSLLGCRQFGYTQAANNNTTAGHLLDTLDEALLETNLESVPFAETLNEESNLYGAPGMYTSTRGWMLVNRTRRAHGDFFGQGGPSEMAPRRTVYAGIDVIAVPSLAGAAIYPRYTTNDPSETNATTLAPVSETSASTNRGGRYFIYDPRYLRHYIFAQKAYQFKDWYPLDQTNPERYVCWVRVDEAIHAESFQRHACVYPAADLTNY